MITRVEIDGFKSLRGLAVDLEPITALVGVNGTGKSNLFDALRVLSRLPVMSVADALAEGRGSRRDQFSRSAEDAVTSMRLVAELLLPMNGAAGKPLDHTRFRYEAAIERSASASGVETVSLRHEHLTAIARAEDAWIDRHPSLEPMARYGREGFFAHLDPDVSPFSASQRTLRWGPPESSLTMGTLGKERSVLSFPPGLGPDFLEEVGEELRRFRFVHLEAGRLRQQSERAASGRLSSDGANLPTALAALSAGLHAELRADLAALIPSFRSFDVVPVGDEFVIEVELTDGQRLPARVLSDGTLRLLALFALVRSSAPGTMIAVEEPETGIHPGALRVLMQALVDATIPHDELPPQILVSSHAPALVAALHARPEALVFTDLVRRGDGQLSTRMRHLWQEGAARDRGATTVSMREVERYLETSRPVIEDP